MKNQQKSSFEEDIDVFNTLLDLINTKINKRRLLRLKAILNAKEKSSDFNGNTDKKELIGILPFVLTNEHIVSTNEDLNKIGKNLGIEIPDNWRNRSKQEIMGRIIYQVSQFNPEKLKTFNQLFKALSPQIKKEDRTNFFTEWEKTIKKVS